MASENRASADSQSENVNSAGISNESVDTETKLKIEKVRTKSYFTCSRNKLLFLIERHKSPCNEEIECACDRLDSAMESVLDVMSSLSELYVKNKEMENGKRVVVEMEKIEEEFTAAYEAARRCMDRQKEQTSEKSEMHTIDINRMNILEHSNVYVQQQNALQRNSIDCQPVKSAQETLKKVGLIDYSTELGANEIANPTTKIQPKALFDETEQRPAYDRITNTIDKENTLSNTNRPIEHHGLNPVVNEHKMSVEAVPFEPTASYNTLSIGQDLWRQLKRVQIPVFNGEKRQYQSWKAAFLACIDSATATAEYKLLQLRQYLSGDALKVIDSLGHSATAYEAAKDRLERKFGGKRRQIAIYLEELEQFRQIRLGSANDIEEFADLLDIAMINLQEAGHQYELGNGSLYIKLQRKIPEAMLARYHRWVFENNKEESVIALRTWIIQEAEFQTIASETMRGLTGKLDDTSTRPTARYGSQQTLFGEIKGGRNSIQSLCPECGTQHGIWNCRDFIRRSVPDRWRIAKLLQLCYRCLGQGHHGKSCPRSRPCGQDGCIFLHNKLLHSPGPTEQPHLSSDNTEVKRPADQDVANSTAHRASCLTEGNVKTEQTTMMTQRYVKTDFVGLRTVPVVLQNGGRSLTVNALLDDASTKTYVNADVAAEPGLMGRTEKVTVNVLNGQANTFESKPVSVELKSVTGSVTMEVNAYTVNRVTGNMPVDDWNKCKERWPHLRDIDFPSSLTRPIVDILIGLDWADLLYAIQEVKGRPARASVA